MGGDMETAVATGTLLLAAATGVLAFFTSRSVEASHRALRADFIPLVVPRGEFGTSTVSAPPPQYETGIYNAGRGSAFDIEIEAAFRQYYLVARAGVLGPGDTDTVHFVVRRDDHQYPQRKEEDSHATLTIKCQDALGRAFETQAAWAYQRKDGPCHYWYHVKVSGPDLPRLRRS
jgi:hypothetical protein